MRRFFFIPVFLSVIVLATLFPTHLQAGFIRPITFPLNVQFSFTDNFSDPRSGGRLHEGIDIMAPKMTPVLAAADGVIVRAPENEPSYGFIIVLRDSDGYTYHYIHLNNDTPGTDDGNGGPRNAYAPGITQGVRVTKGQHIAYVGDSGNAESVGSHLHFEMHDPQGTPLNPYESLIAAQRTALTAPQGSAPAAIIITVPSSRILVKYLNNPNVYIVAGDIKYLIQDMPTFTALGFSTSDIKIIPDSQTYRTGIPIQGGPGVVLMRDGMPITGVPAPSNGFVFRAQLTMGARGSEVSALQSILKQLGHFTYPTITGYFGTATRDAVIRLQQANNIEPVGYVGPKTRAFLNAL